MDTILEFLFHVYELSEIIELILNDSSLIRYYIDNSLNIIKELLLSMQE